MQLTYRGNIYNYQPLQIEPDLTLAIASKYRGVSSQINLGNRSTFSSPIAFKYRGVNYTKKINSYQDLGDRQQHQPVLV